MSDGITPLTPEQVAHQESQASKEGYIKRVLVSVDIATNVVLGGHEDETISSRTARDAEQHRKVGELVTKALDVIQKDHGAKAEAGDLERAQTIVTIESTDPAIEK